MPERYFVSIFADMLRYISVLCAAVAVLGGGCSKGADDEPDRPGVEKPVAVTFFFAGDNPEECVVDGDGTVFITVGRTPAGAACDVGLTVAEGADFASVSAAHFAEGEATATAALAYSTARMGARRRTVVLRCGTGSLNIGFILSDEPWSPSGERLLFADGAFTRINVSCRTVDGKDYWRIDNTGRTFSADDGWSGTEFTALKSGEYIFPAGTGYATAEICDGWLLPVLRIGAAALVPSENTWMAPARIGSGRISVFGPYFNASPLTPLNRAPLSAEWRIDIDGSSAVIKPQEAGFVNTGVFPFTFRIAATGTFDGTTLHFDRPLHNYADGREAPLTDQSWATPAPAIIKLNPL